MEGLGIEAAGAPRYEASMGSFDLDSLLLPHSGVPAQRLAHFFFSMGGELTSIQVRSPFCLLRLRLSLCLSVPLPLCLSVSLSVSLSTRLTVCWYGQVVYVGMRASKYLIYPFIYTRTRTRTRTPIQYPPAHFLGFRV